MHFTPGPSRPPAHPSCGHPISNSPDIRLLVEKKKKGCDTTYSVPLLGIVNQLNKWPGVVSQRGGIQGHRVSSLAAVSPQGRLQARGIGLLFPRHPARVTMAQVKWTSSAQGTTAVL